MAENQMLIKTNIPLILCVCEGREGTVLNTRTDKLREKNIYKRVNYILYVSDEFTLVSQLRVYLSENTHKHWSYECLHTGANTSTKKIIHKTPENLRTFHRIFKHK